MARHIITIANHRFLVSEEHIERVRDSLVEAVRRGGDFVTLPLGDKQVGVLVSAGLPIFSEVSPEAVDTDEMERAGAGTAESLTTPIDEFDDWGI